MGDDGQDQKTEKGKDLPDERPVVLRTGVKLFCRLLDKCCNRQHPGPTWDKAPIGKEKAKGKKQHLAQLKGQDNSGINTNRETPVPELLHPFGQGGLELFRGHARIEADK
ncbi:MAG: hypothetical protein BroJett011_47240 [Chloroflexota bacterium]|nr:MAG: hypothetical protein BroJett011_47240 [Chloroflexota bacterium]